MTVSTVTQIATDVTKSVYIDDPASVHSAVHQILTRRYPGTSFAELETLFVDLARLYQGLFPGFHACETAYHNLHHVLDVTLATARLIDGYEASHRGAEKLGPDLALLAIIVAMFHDSGYIRRTADRKHKHGAEYTRIHVGRSARFMRDYLPTVGMQKQAGLAGKLVHFTGYEVSPERLSATTYHHSVVGALVGTADVLAQMADAQYLQKCYRNLYREFEIGGIARQRNPDGSIKVIYSSAQELLQKTPEFMQQIVRNRLQGYFNGRYRYAGVHFGGDNLYMKALLKNRQALRQIIRRAANSEIEFETALAKVA